ncbi:hypothetical protein ACFU99_03860 [Streptomyces sp. NPDC057654]|uniref:hypothetical protein n=1 Tax=Streptomyces sp. NPDC057654 TaxID=3346196 RepID=UPI0036A1E1DE
MSTAVRIAPAATAAHALIVSNRTTITSLALRDFGPWWPATATDVLRPAAHPTVDARVDASHRAALTRMIIDYAYEDILYAGERTLVRQETNGDVYAAQPAQRLAYHSVPARRWLAVSGQEREPVALAAVRLARDLVRAQLLRAGWVLLHASAVARDGRALLAVGPTGAGKSTVALTLARQDGWDLLANDRVFARLAKDGAVQLLPWPAAAAFGFGLLDGLGLYDTVRSLYLTGEQLHPTQHPQVTHALTVGDRTPQWNGNRRTELTCQFFPDQVVSWLGCTLATHATAAAVLHPRISAELAVPEAGEGAELGARDAFSAATDDRYPDPGPVRERLAALPGQSVVLGHHAEANTDALTRLADTLLSAG